MEDNGIPAFIAVLAAARIIVGVLVAMTFVLWILLSSAV